MGRLRWWLVVATLGLGGCELLYSGSDLHGHSNGDLGGVDLAGRGDLAQPGDLGPIPKAHCPGSAVSFDVRTYDLRVGAPLAIAIGDFNDDTFVDVVAADDSSSSLSILLGDGKGGFTVSLTLVALPCSPNSIAVDDFNKDGRPDVAVACPSDIVMVINANESGKASFLPAAAVGLKNATPTLLLAGTFDGDTNPDLVYADPNHVDSSTQAVGEVVFVYGNGDGTMSAGTTLEYQGHSPDALSRTDLNNDGIDDVVAGLDDNDDYLTLFLSKLVTGVVTYTPTTVAATGTSGDGTLDGTPIYLSLGDLNGDGLVDIAAVAASQPTTIDYLINSGSAKLPAYPNMPQSIPYNGADPTEIGIGDFNCDGSADIVMSKRANGAGSDEWASVVPSNHGVFEAPGTMYGVANPAGLVVYDLNGDGASDIILGSYYEPGAAGPDTVITVLVSTSH